MVRTLAPAVADEHGKSMGFGPKPTANEMGDGAKDSLRQQRNARAKESTAKRVDLKPQRQHREDSGAGFFKRTPDFQMVVKDKVPGSNAVETSEVHLVEQTVDVNFTCPAASRKAVQIPSTIEMVARNSKYQGARIVYHIIAPVDAPPATRQAIELSIAESGLGSRVKVVWHAIKPPHG